MEKTERERAMQIIEETETYSDAYFQMMDAGIPDPDLYWYESLELGITVNCMGGAIIGTRDFFC